MKKVLALLVALLAVFTLSACTDEEALTGLQDSIDTLQTQLDSSDLTIADLEDLNDELQADIDDLQLQLDAAATANSDLADDVAALEEDLADAQLLLNNAIDALAGQLTDVTAAFTASLAATSAEFQAALNEANVAFTLALDEANASISDLQQALADSNATIDDLLDQLAVFEVPIIYGVNTYTQSVFEELEAKINAFDIQEGDLTADIVMTSPGSFDEPGTYTVTFEVTDSEGHTGEFAVTVEVSVPDTVVANYLSGIDLSKLDAENKGILFAAAERYLLENVYGGVPLYTSAARVMYSDRVSLFSPEFNGVMGFGTAFSSFTADDSTVLMYGSTYGNAGEYTWRASFVTDPTSLNPWTADDSNSSDFIDLFTGSLYTFYFDATKTGYEINGELASGDPIAVNPTEVNGKVYSTVWQIPITEGLTWTYHPNFDTSVLPAGHEVLDANDYLWTWKYALDNTWFRAISGGGDFITSGIKKAADYVAGTADWEDVGMKAIDDNTIQLTFTSDKSMFDIKYMLSGSWTPINQQLFEYLGAENYGLDPETVASSGIYVFETWTSGQFLYFSKNPNFVNADMYHYTGQQFVHIADQELNFTEFLEGRLESASVPSTRVTEFATDPRVKVSPAATTWRLMINGFGTEEARDAYIDQYPEFGLAEDFTPEPILQYLEMRKALYFGFDRYHAAIEVVQTYLPAFSYFTASYFLDAESGISVRGTEAGAAILEDFGGGTYGYSPDAAVAYFKSAVNKAIADGYYLPGTPEAYTTIEFQLYWASSGNVSATAMVAELETQYEELLVDDVNYVNIDLIINDVAFPTNYYNFMMVANMDLGIGGISGSQMDAPSFLDVFNDDNVSGFTLNWGIDTHSVNVEVLYLGLDGVTRHELWSYNALVAAMNGKEYIKDGIQQTVYDTKLSLIQAYLDMAGSSYVSAADGSVLAQYILGDTMENLAAAGGYDAIHADIVMTGDGGEVLFVVAESDGGFELYGDGQYALYYDGPTAIQAHNTANYGYTLVAATGPLSDAEIEANAYIAGTYGFTTAAEVADALGLPAEYTEVWATTWNPSSPWDDAYVVLHIGDYYIGYYWL